MTRPFYLTRDSVFGEPADRIEVWDAPPRRRTFARLTSVVWGGCGERPRAFYTLAEARAKFRTLPDNEREVVRYG